jgi:4'-phosphopantetheinyl transferase
MTRVVRRDPRHPAGGVPLTVDTVHLWTIRLDEADPDQAALSSDERERAVAFRFERDRRRFVAAHAALRSILARYLEVSPESLVFLTGARGKPMLDPARHGAAVHFNLSHSHELALVAVIRDRDVGVDVERARAVPDLEGLVARFFAPAEQAALGRLPADRRPEAFFRVWTLKEAYLKACGDGLSRELRHIVVDLDADAQRARVQALDRPGDDCRWEVFTLAPEPGYVAAIAIEAAPASAPA